MIDNTRLCGWCNIDITRMRANAKYCCMQHKKNAGSKRHRERNPDYYILFRARNPEYYQKYREANRAKLRAYARMNRQRQIMKDPELARVQAQAWWAANGERHRGYQRRRRVAKFANPGSVGVSECDWIRLVRRYRFCCVYCGKRPKVIHMDHVIPLKRGGRHAIGNVLPACAGCNQSKSARLLAEWRHGITYSFRSYR